MEHLQNMLDLISEPAFSVENGAIHQLNRGAQAYLLQPGTPVQDLIAAGAEEYALLDGGTLYLTLKLGSSTVGASVVRMEGKDYFIMEQDTEQAQLQAMALAARELRRPLATVMTLADRLFPLSDAQGDPAVQEQIARINRGLFQMLRTVSNMSDAYRYASEEGNRNETVNIPAFLEEIFAGAAALVGHSQIKLQYTSELHNLYGSVDRELLERAVNNLISNAVKFTPAGGTVNAKLTSRGQTLYLSVTDSGSGIPGHLQANLYSHFRRGPALEDGRHGIGLGMVMVRSAALHHGGTVLMEQCKEGGTRITLSIPLRQSNEAIVRSDILRIDYAGERNHQLIELSDVLPHTVYKKEDIN